MILLITYKYTNIIFMVMKNITKTEGDITHIFDIKGSEKGR